MTPQTRILAATVLGSSMAFIDGSVVTVALPAMQSALGAGVAEMQWVVNAYLLTLGALVLIGGALGDRLGRVRMFTWGVVLFAVASAACGLAPGAVVLVGARAVQGIGAALLVPSSLAILGAGFSDAERGAAVGTWSGIGALTAAIGPALGGALVDHVSWRAIFWINLPLAAATLWLAHGVAESRGEATDDPIDWPGAALAVAGLGALTYGFIAAPDAGLVSVHALGPIGVGVALLGLFLWQEARARGPMLPLELFRSVRFSGASLLTLLLYFALGGALFFLPYTLVNAHHYSATGAGLTLLPAMVLLGVLSRWAGRFSAHARLLLTIGPIFAAGGFALLAWRAADASFWSGVLPGMLLLGIGMAIAVAPLVTVVMGDAGPARAGAASGINNAVARVAGLLAVAVLGLVYRAAGTDLVHGFAVVSWAACGCALASAGAAVLMIGPDRLKNT